MDIISILLLGTGLSMDAFAVAVCKGLASKRPDIKKGLIVGTWFGMFQALMPLTGYLLGNTFASYIGRIDHWIAFILLSFIGFNMIREAFGENEKEMDGSLEIMNMMLLAVATSIDALAVGITFAFLNVNIAIACTLIGLVTFCISAGGFYLGHFAGRALEKKARILGGVILVGLGIKILAEHLLAK